MPRNNQKKSARTTGYRVESESYPSGFGCYYGQDLDQDYIEACTTTKIVGEYDTLTEAEEAAIEERDYDCTFQDWAEEYYGDAGPPFFSSDGENYDDDDTTHIYIVDIAKEIAKKAQENAEKEKAIQKARASKPPTKKKAKTASARTFGPQKGNFKPDMEIFLRNPSRIAGGETHLPTEYATRGTGKGSFAYLIQRLSDRNYAMRSLCLENSGARYTSFSLPNQVMRSVAWLPDTNLEDHSSNDTILDTFHTDLFHPKTGKHVLTAENLAAAASSKTECLFLTNFSDDSLIQKESSKVIVKAIQTCSSNLKCITLNLTTMSVEILEALAKCQHLRGILLQDTKAEWGVADHVLDKSLAKVLSSCQHLKWIYVDHQPFHGDCWRALGAGACPDLQVLWIDCPSNPNDRIRYTVGDHNLIRRVVAERSLKICMINPDEKLKSSYIPAAGGKKAWDHLTGKKAPKMPDYDHFYEEDQYYDY